MSVYVDVCKQTGEHMCIHVHTKAYVRMCVCIYLGWCIYVYMHMEASGQPQLLFHRTHTQIPITK